MLNTIAERKLYDAYEATKKITISLSEASQITGHSVDTIKEKYLTLSEDYEKGKIRRRNEKDTSFQLVLSDVMKLCRSVYARLDKESKKTVALEFINLRIS